MVLKSCIAILVTSSIGQLQWIWFLEAQSLRDLDLFSDAAQGPLGSLSWLWAHRFRQPLTALGAIITVIAIAIDPFIQQVVQPANCMTTLANGITASVPRTNYLDFQVVPGSLEASLTAGFYTAEKLSDFACESGNCTFTKSYNSLSFCSKCTDRSSDVVIEKQCSRNVGPGACDVRTSAEVLTTSWNITTTMPPFDLNFYDEGPYYSTPDMFSVQISSGNQGDSASSSFFTGKTIGVILGLSDSAIARKEPPDWGQSLYDCDDPASNDTWYCRGYGAAQCVLQPCVRTYSCSIDSGTVNEVTVEHSDLDQTWGFGQPSLPRGSFVTGDWVDKQLFGLVDTQCISDDERQRLKEEGYDTDKASRWLPYNITFHPYAPSINASSPFPRSLLAHECLYLIDAWFIQHLWDSVLSPLLLGTVTRHFDGDQAQKYKFGFNGTQQLLHLYNMGHVSMKAVDATFANLAQAMTLWVRENGMANYSRRAEGEVLHYAVCLQVNWSWVALPGLLAAGALVLFLLTLRSAARRAMPPWKSSTLPMLFHGPAGSDWVDEDMVDFSKTGKTAYRDVETVEGIHQFASGVFVKMVDQGGQYELRQVAPRNFL